MGLNPPVPENTENYIFLSVPGNFSLYGRSSLIGVSLMLSSIYSKYLDILILLMIAVLMMENNTIVYFAPSFEPDVINTFLLITNGLTARSAILFVISTYTDNISWMSDVV